MYKIYIVIGMFLFLSCGVFAQDKKKKIDSLENLLKTSNGDTAKASLFIKIAEELKNNNPKRCLEKAQEALRLFEKSSEQNGIAKAYIMMGVASNNLGDYENALSYHGKALAISKATGNKKNEAKAHSNMGIVKDNQGNYAEAEKNYAIAISILEKTDDKKSLAAAYNNMGLTFFHEGDYPRALKYYQIALQLISELGLKPVIAACNNNIGLANQNLGKYPEALKYFFTSLKIYEELGNKAGVAMVYDNMGNIYFQQKNEEETLKNYYASLKIRKEVGNKAGIATSYANIGNYYFSTGNDTAAITNYVRSLKIREEIGDKAGIATCYTNIGSVYGEKKDYDEAIKNYLISLKLREEIGDKAGIASAFINLGNCYYRQKKFVLANEYLNKGLQLAIELKYTELIRDAYRYLSESSENSTDFKKAHTYYKQYISYRDSLVNEENTKKTVQTEMQYEFDKKETVTKAEQGKKDVVAAEEKRKQQIITAAISIGLFLVVILAIVIFRSLQQNKRKNAIITLQKTEVEKQKEIAEHQREIVEEKNKEILDSIHYAKRIQSALLTSEGYIKKHIPGEFFILYKPKDIVAGDFYWAINQHNRFYLAAADCTGHGVPGAFMSLLNISFLNEIVIEKKISSPDLILNEIRNDIIKALNPEGNEDAKDGMDCILCAFDFSNLKLNYAAANNSFYIIRNKQFINCPADKMPVGMYNEMQPFTLQSISLERGDIVYLLTDGYPDQFGGPKGKKFKYKQLEELLLANSHKPFEIQKEILNEIFETWKGTLEQVDDVCIIGVKI